MSFKAEQQQHSRQFSPTISGATIMLWGRSRAPSCLVVLRLRARVRAAGCPSEVLVSVAWIPYPVSALHTSIAHSRRRLLGLSQPVRRPSCYVDSTRIQVSFDTVSDVLFTALSSSSSLEILFLSNKTEFLTFRSRCRNAYRKGPL